MGNLPERFLGRSIPARVHSTSKPTERRADVWLAESVACTPTRYSESYVNPHYSSSDSGCGEESGNAWSARDCPFVTTACDANHIPRKPADLDLAVVAIRPSAQEEELCGL